MLPEFHWSPRSYLDARVHEVLTAGDAVVDAVVGEVALLLACVGALEQADRLCGHWRAVTERPVAALMPDAPSARAFRVLLRARRDRPTWAAELEPGDPVADDRAQRAYLGGTGPALAIPGISGDTAAVVEGVAGHLIDAGGRRDPRRILAAEAAGAAASGDIARAVEALCEWAAQSGARPRTAMVAGSAELTTLLLGGALAAPWGIEPDWPVWCSGELAAALHARYRVRHPHASSMSWQQLIERIVAARSAEDLPAEPLPAPATAHTIDEAEKRLGVRLSDDLRAFLSTCDGLPADVIFPRLLSAAELHRGPAGSIVLSERTAQGFLAVLPSGRVLEWDPVLGESVHPGVRALVEHHLRLLEQSRE